jgi:hypothetical protein
VEIVGRVFFAGLDVTAVRLEIGFFATLLLESFDLEGFRATDLAATALFALGRTDFVFIARPLTDDLAEDFRAGARDVDRLKLFVMGLLTRNDRDMVPLYVVVRQPVIERQFNTASPVNQRKKGSCGHN